MKSRRIAAVVVLLAGLGIWLFLSRDTPAALTPTMQDSDRTRAGAINPPAFELRTVAQRSADATALEAEKVETVALGAQEFAGTRLHVVDDATGAELDHIALYRVSLFETRGMLLLSKRQLSDCVGINLGSPITIQPDESRVTNGPTTYLAVNSDHAWGKISIDSAAEGDHFLRLALGGALRVTLAGAEPDSHVNLILWRMDEAPREGLGAWWLSELRQGPLPMLELDGLQIGTFRVFADHGGRIPREILATRDFRIRAGECTEVALTIGENVVQQVEVRISVAFDPGWALERFRLDVETVDDESEALPKRTVLTSADMTRASGGAYECKPVMLDSGMYHFTIMDAAFDAQVMIGPDPVQQLSLKVPAPGLVVVEVLHDETGSVVTDARLQLLGKPPELPHYSHFSHSIPEKAPGRFEFRAPIGLLRLFAWSPANKNYPEAIRLVDVVIGTNPVTIRLTREILVILRLHEGERELPWSKDWLDLPRFEHYIEHFKGDEVFPARGFDARSGLFMLHFAEGGAYRLNMKIPGFANVGDPGLFYFEVGYGLNVVDIRISRE